MILGREYAPESVRTGKAKGVVEVEVASRDGGGVDNTSDGAEWGVVVVSSDTIA